MNHCDRHNFRWWGGDSPCPQCRKENDELNKLTLAVNQSRLPHYKWPLSKAEKKTRHD